MNASLAIRKCYETRNLPTGHIAHKAAQDKVNEIYQKSREIEKGWYKRFGKASRFENVQEALTFCNQICQQIGEKPVRAIVINSKKVQPGAAGHYNPKTREIHFTWGGLDMGILIHELTHHCGPGNHDEVFCDLLGFLFRIAYEMRTGKKPHIDW